MNALRVIAGGRAGVGDPGPLRFKADAGLLAELYEKHAASVYARCRYLLRNDDEAKDALQEVFARALRALPEFRAAASPTTWIPTSSRATRSSRRTSGMSSMSTALSGARTGTRKRRR